MVCRGTGWMLLKFQLGFRPVRSFRSFTQSTNISSTTLWSIHKRAEKAQYEARLCLSRKNPRGFRLSCNSSWGEVRIVETVSPYKALSLFDVTQRSDYLEGLQLDMAKRAWGRVSLFANESMRRWPVRNWMSNQWRFYESYNICVLSQSLELIWWCYSPLPPLLQAGIVQWESRFNSESGKGRTSSASKFSLWVSRSLVRSLLLLKVSKS